MSELLLQLTDPHIGARWADADPLDTLRTVFAAVRALPDRPVAALLTGDLASGGSDEQYAALAPVLAELGLPIHVLPGNHDDRAALRRHLELPGEGQAPIQYALALAGLHVLMLDTVAPGEAGGELGPERLAWLASELSERPESPTLVAMHHPPFLCGVAEMDRIGLPAADRDGFADVLREHPQVCGIIAGHVHRTIASSVAGCPVLTIPSTYCQLPLDLTRLDPPMVPGPLAFAVHTLVDGRLVSHVETLAATAAG